MLGSILRLILTHLLFEAKCIKLNSLASSCKAATFDNVFQVFLQ